MTDSQYKGGELAIANAYEVAFNAEPMTVVSARYPPIYELHYIARSLHERHQAIAQQTADGWRCTLISPRVTVSETAPTIRQAIDLALDAYREARR
jgi:hypothetical protein